MFKRRAFTLIELLVVIAIIAILMGILMPALKKAKEQGQSAACKGNLKGYTLAVSMYAQENDDAFPDHRTCYFTSSARLAGETIGGSHIHQRWCNTQVNLKYRPELAGEFFGYLSDVRALICPTFKGLAKNKGVSISEHVRWDAMEDEALYEPWHNYTMNAYLGPKASNSVVQKTMQVKDAANVFVFADEGPYYVDDYNRQGLNDTSLWVIYATAEARAAVKRFGSKREIRPGPEAQGNWGGQGGQFCDIIAGFHNAPSGDVTGGKGNATFVDGHVAAVHRDDSFAVAWPE
jgi:prepilin-type N-terminal cleavage/methylation domain-containing protein/prepilin-type processing-associated H-X9-DG protein